MKVSETQKEKEKYADACLVTLLISEGSGSAINKNEIVNLKVRSLYSEPQKQVQRVNSADRYLR